MHVKAINIDSVNPLGVCRALVPVHSLEERKNYQNAWFFRLSAELQSCVDKGWKIGFFTLTYDNEHLPYLPSSVFANDQPFEPIPCFCRQDVRSFIVSIRKWFFDQFNIKGVKYLIASELGEHTQRSHYHGLIAWPSSVPAELVHARIKQVWCDKGFVFPRDARGGYDSHGYMHKPFELESNPVAAARYASKYVCKDFAFLDKIKGKHLLTKSREFRDCGCFHIQSKSLGLSVLANASDEDKLSWLKDGYWFAGHDKPVEIPVYIRNKILFDPYYVIDEQGNRLVRRKSTEFFNQHYEEIFDKKVDTMSLLFEKMFDVNWWRKSINPSVINKDVDPLGIQAANMSWYAYKVFMDKYSFTPVSLAKKYISQFGVHPDNIYHAPPALQWFARYCEDNVLLGYPHISPDVYDDYIDFNRELELILGATRYFSDNAEKDDIQRNSEIQDFWKSLA